MLDILMGINVYYAEHILKDVSIVGRLAMFFTIPLLVGFLSVGYFNARFGRMKTLYLGLTLMIIGSALVIIDGFNTSACALVAKTLVPQAMDYVMASHLSAEKAAKSSLENLGLEAYVDLGLCLGEASGGSIQMGMLDLAVHMYLAVTGGKA